MRAAGRLGRTVDPAPALRRLLARDPLAHAAVRDGEHADDPHRGPRAARARRVPLIQRQGITLVGISVTNLADGRRSSCVLPFDEQWAEELDIAVDEVRDRFGSAALVRAVLLGRSRGFAMPLLPD